MGALMKNKVPFHVTPAFFDAEYAGVGFFAQYVLNAPGRPERFHFVPHDNRVQGVKS
jgi:hypothetical protein